MRSDPLTRLIQQSMIDVVNNANNHFLIFFEIILQFGGGNVRPEDQPGVSFLAKEEYSEKKPCVPSDLYWYAYSNSNMG